MGVLGVRPEEGECLTAGQKDLLESMGAQLAMALEREELRAERARTRLMEESEKLHRSLLDSVSHEFKTPLAVIEGGCENWPDVPRPHRRSGKNTGKFYWPRAVCAAW